MKKKNIYTILLIFFVAMLAIIVYRYEANPDTVKDQNVYTLLPRSGTAAQMQEWPIIKQQCFTLLNAIKQNPKDTKSLTQLATLYIHEARVTGNYTYYDKAALKYTDDALAADANCYEAMILKSLLYLSQHHFADGLELAEKARAINPYNAYVYGLVVDGNVEMGNYDSAVANADKMLSIRPDLRSYSRASYLREIYGDYPGAIQAMKMAVEAGAPGDESTEWSRIQLGKLYENTGDLLNAKMHYTIALQNRPGYAYALAGLARVAAAEKDDATAIKYYQQADTCINDFSIKEGIADLYRVMGDKAKADAIEKKAIDMMTQEAQKGNTDANVGHYVDKELAYAYLNIGDYDNALKHALLEYDRRPDNIDVNECLAWVYYNKGDFANALKYITVALKTNSKNPTLLCRAGLIYAKSGNRELAKNTLQQVLKTNANIQNDLRAASNSTLQTL